MRIAPVLIPYLRRPSPNLWLDTLLAASLTHNDGASTAACVAFVAMLWELLGRDAPPDPAWWVERYAEIAAPLESGEKVHTAAARQGSPTGRVRSPNLWRNMSPLPPPKS